MAITIKMILDINIMPPMILEIILMNTETILRKKMTMNTFTIVMIVVLEIKIIITIPN